MKRLLLAICAAPLFTFGQYTVEEVENLAEKSSEAQLVMEASRMLQEDYYFFSEIIVDKLLTIKPESSNYNYRKGFIVLNSRGDFETALKYLQQGAKSVKNNYDMYSPKELSAPSDVYFHLARCYHLDMQLDSAEVYYNKFIATSHKKSELLAIAQLNIRQVGIARTMSQNPKSATVRNLELPVNSSYPEYSPVISLDGKSLYYTSRRPWKNNETEIYRDPKLHQYPEDIYLSYLDYRLKWSEPRKLDFCVDNVNEATISVSIDEQKIFTYQDVSGNGDIFTSNYAESKFQDLEMIDFKGVNSEYWETHCVMAPDGKTLYFVSDRPGGYGGRDIYRISKFPDGRWSEPINLGATVNSKYDEDSPFLAIDGKTLYFSSNGPLSAGGFDIFVTVRDNENNWSNPINLGFPINSTGDDLFYTTTISGKKGYLSSFRKGGMGEKDIYEIENDFMNIQNAAVISGNIYTIGTAKLSSTAHVVIRCENCDNPEIIVPVRTRDGGYIQPLEKCRSYEILFMDSKTKVIRSEKFKTACDNQLEEIVKDAIMGDFIVSLEMFERSTHDSIPNAVVEIIRKDDKSVLETLTKNDQGNYVSTYLKDKAVGHTDELAIRISAPEYITVTKPVQSDFTPLKPYQEKFVMDKMDVGLDIGKIVEINPIYFDLDKFDIREDAEVELDKIVKIMNENPTMRIELGSHTDCRATMQYNLMLSDKRAKASAEYIRKRITNPTRIYGKGYGESQLINDCGCEGEVESECTEEQHQENRRTEFKIVKK